MIKKIFVILITVVALVAIGALVLNVVLPNTAKQLVNQVENQIYNATGMTFDFNNDGVKGTSTSDVSGDTAGDDYDTVNGVNGGTVNGFN